MVTAVRSQKDLDALIARAFWEAFFEAEANGNIDDYRAAQEGPLDNLLGSDDSGAAEPEKVDKNYVACEWLGNRYRYQQLGSGKCMQPHHPTACKCKYYKNGCCRPTKD